MDSSQCTTEKGNFMPETTPPGISENGAGALSYLTIIPAIIFLIMPPYNKSPYVRFHAWQCIFLTIAWIALFVVLAIVGRIPLVGFVIFPLMLLLDLGMFILW